MRNVWRKLGLFLLAAVLLAGGAEAAEIDSIETARPESVEGTLLTEDEALLWTKDLNAVTYRIQIPASGDYALEVVYRAKESQSDFIQLAATLTSAEGSTQFPIELARPVEYGAIRTDVNGDQLRAETQTSRAAHRVLLRTTDNVTNEATRFSLHAGEALLRLEGVRTDFVLCGLRFVPYPESHSYAQISAEGEYRTAKAYTGEALIFQAEELMCSSEASIGAQYDRSDALVQPCSARDMLLNITGGANFNSDGQWIQWELDVPTSALYTLKFKARQYYKNGLSVNRRIYIDDQIPFSEAENLAFSYSGGWQMVTLCAEDGSEAPVYLSAGRHTLRMEVVPGPEAEAIVGLTALVSDLTDVYRSIMMITGVNPDRNREYALERDIPDLLPRLEAISERLEEQRALLEGISEARSGELASITTLQSQIGSFLEKPDTIPVRLNNFKSNIDALSSFMLTISDQPLDLDYILLDAPGAENPAVSASFFQNLWFEVKSLFYSFFPKTEEDSDVLTVWVAVGRDQMQVIKDMADNTYTAQTGQKVSFSLVQQGITEAILAGNSPDVVLYAANTDVVNLAMRGALYPLDGADGLAALAAQCQSEAFVPYDYDGSCYGVPLTQNFPMMFVRTDIFEELGLEVPQTWEELYALIPAIQRKNMQVGIPSAETTFATMLWQQGQGYYNDDRTATNFENQTAIEVFRQYTRLFTDYDLPVTYDFYNRFRSGEMPLGITDYVEYNRLLVAAPEITGKWAMYPVPETQRGEKLDGSVQSSSGQGGYVLRGSGRTQEAVQFLLWFASAEQQAEYGKKTEALLGALGRYAPANQEAFTYLPWLPEEQERILAQWQNVKEQPQMPGAYYTPRNLTNAFRSVVYDGMNYREALLKYSAEIDRELERKREEYSGKER